MQVGMGNWFSVAQPVAPLAGLGKQQGGSWRPLGGHEDGPPPLPPPTATTEGKPRPAHAVSSPVFLTSTKTEALPRATVQMNLRCTS